MKNTLKAILVVMTLTFAVSACGPKSNEATDSTGTTDSTVVEPTPPADSVPADSTQM